MATPFDHYPYTNFHELNLAYFIVHFREIFAQWDELYTDMLSWKDATDKELAEWKSGVLSDIDAWETALNNSLDAWKADTESDITGWMNDVIDALDAWKAAFQTLFDTTFSNLEDIKTDAEDARDDAIAAQTAAEAAAASISASAAQISINTSDITDLQNALYNTETLDFSLLDFTKGLIKSTDGQNNSSTIRLRLNDAIYLGKGSSIYSTEQFAIFEYSDADASSDHYEGNVLAIGTHSDPYIVAESNYYRIMLAYIGNTTIIDDGSADDNRAELIATLSVIANVPDWINKSEGVAYYKQSMSDAQKQIARSNINAVELPIASSEKINRGMITRYVINSATGSITGSNNNRITTTYLYLAKSSVVSVLGDLNFRVYKCDDSLTYVPSGYVSKAKEYLIPETAYYRFSILKDSGADILDSEIDTVLNVFSVLETRTPGVLPTEFKFVVPEFVPCAGGRQINIYYQNVVYGYNTKNAQRILMDSSVFKNHDGFARWDVPSQTSSGQKTTNYINIYADNTLKFTASKMMSIQRIGTNSGSGLTKKVLIIGDSLTGGYSTIRTELVSLFSTDPMSVEFVGTHHSDSVPDEAYSGWGYYTFYNNETRGESDPTINPFWNPETEHFDFSYYMANSGISTPDYVLICLGTNDMSRTDDEIKNCSQAIINSILSYNASILIGVWLPPVSATLENANSGANATYHVLSTLIDTYSGRQSENIYTIPVYLNIDTVHDYRTVEENISARNSDYKIRFTTDNLHPTTAGFEKIADMLYSFLKYLGGLNT